MGLRRVGHDWATFTFSHLLISSLQWSNSKFRCYRKRTRLSEWALTGLYRGNENRNWRSTSPMLVSSWPLLSPFLARTVVLWHDPLSLDLCKLWQVLLPGRGGWTGSGKGLALDRHLLEERQVAAQVTAQEFIQCNHISISVSSSRTDPLWSLLTRTLV